MLLESDIMSSGELPVISYDIVSVIKIQCATEYPDRLDLSCTNRRNYTRD